MVIGWRTLRSDARLADALTWQRERLGVMRPREAERSIRHPGIKPQVQGTRTAIRPGDGVQSTARRIEGRFRHGHPRLASRIFDAHSRTGSSRELPVWL